MAKALSKNALMNYLDLKNFLKDIATANGWGFAHNTEHLLEDAGSVKAWADSYILCMDEPEGTLRYNGRVRDEQSFGFFLVKQSEKGKWEREDIIYDGAKTLWEMFILAVIMQNVDDSEGLFANYDPEDTSYRKVGPMGNERLFGIYVSLNDGEELGL